MTDFYISPTGSGNKSGDSLQNAATIGSLNGLVAKADGGDRIVLIADKGDYAVAKSINISNGGDNGNPITIVGQSSTGQDMAATFVGTRAADYSPTAAQGTEVLRLNTGASNLIFDNIDFRDVATAFRLGGNAENITIQDSSAENVNRYIDNLAIGTGATVSGLTVRNIDVEGFAKGVIRLRYDTNDVLIDNVTGDSQHIDGANFAIGIHLDGTAHDVVVSNTTIGNITDTTNTYRNGDGFATERGVYNVVFENTLSYNNTDAGYDLKSMATTLINAIADGNTRNFRFWADDTIAENITGLNPTYHGGSSTKPSNVWLAADGHVEINNSTFLDNDGRGFLFDLSEDGAQLIIRGVFSNQSATGNVDFPDPVILSPNASLIGFIGKWIDAIPAAAGNVPGTIQLTKQVISEDAAVGTLVATVASAHATNFSLADDAGGRFVIDSKTGEISVARNAVLDFETAECHTLSVIASNNHGSSSPATLIVQLSNVVENQTYFGKDTGEPLVFSSSDNWTVDAFGGADQIVTLGGLDRIRGGGGDDEISAGGGDDIVYFASQNSGFDRVNGGGGFDTLLAEKNNATIGISFIENVERISSGGKAGVSIKGSAGDDYLDLTSVYLDRITRSIEMGNGNDIAIGNKQSNIISGGSGTDVISGGAGVDSLSGGSGNDTFKFYACDNSSKSSGIDTITDFSHGADKLDIAGLDARTDILGNQTFTFLGRNDFTGNAGELRVETGSKTTIVYADVNADKIADVEIILQGRVTLTQSDFIF